MKIPIQNQKRIRLQTALLRVLYTGGVVATGLIAPNLLRLVGAYDRSAARRKELYARIATARSRLKQQKYVTETVGSKGSFLRLTPAGKKCIERILMREYRIVEQVRWDGKWRVLIFDIREKRRRVRNRLRRLLAGVGFVRLQDSVWVHPYPCDEFVVLVRAHLASGVGELRCFVADALESDRDLRTHFRL